MSTSYVKLSDIFINTLHVSFQYAADVSLPKCESGVSPVVQSEVVNGVWQTPQKSKLSPVTLLPSVQIFNVSSDTRDPSKSTTNCVKELSQLLLPVQ